MGSWHVLCLLQARNLIKAGFSVTVWNRSPEKCKELEGEGASMAASSADCVAASDITIAMLADPPAALAVAKDACKGISQGMLIIPLYCNLLHFQQSDLLAQKAGFCHPNLAAISTVTLLWEGHR